MTSPEPNVAEPRGTVSVFEIQPNQTFNWPDDQLKAGAEPLVCREVEQAEADLVQAAMEQAGNYPPGDAAHRLATGRKGYIGQLVGSGQIATYGWVAFDKEPLGPSGFAFQPPAGDTWLYDFATLPDYRGRGYYPILLRYIVEELAKQGVRRAWIGTAPGNDVSARSIARAGFLKVAEVRINFDPQTGLQFEPIPMPGVDLALFETGLKAHVPV